MGERINADVEFPLEGLDLSKHVIGKENGGKSLIYDCYAVSNHMGGVGGGHYTAYAKNPVSNKWYEFDDSSCSSIRSEKPESQVVSSMAYNLFYRRRDWHEKNRTEGCNFDKMALRPDMTLITKK